MRRPQLLILALFLWLTASVLPAQRLVLGPAVPLHDMPMLHGVPSVVALDDGEFVLGSRFPTSYRTAHAYFATVDAAGETVLASWDSPYSSFAESLGLMATEDNDFFHTAIAGLFGAYSTGLAFRLRDPFEETDASNYVFIDSEDTRPGQYDMARLPNGHFVAIWGSAAAAPSNDILGIVAQIFTAEGDLIGPVMYVTPAVDYRLQVAATPSGGFVAAWIVEDEDQRRVLARAFDAQGMGGPIQEIVGSDEASNHFDLTTRADGTTLVVWSRIGDDSYSLVARRLDPQARPYPETLPINATGHSPRATTDRFGRTWITWQDDLQVFARVLGSNGALSERIQVPPRIEGRHQRDPQIAVNHEGRAMVTWRENGATYYESILQAHIVEIDDICMESDTMLCLHQGRFQVEVEWTDHAGDIGPGRVVPFQSSDSGLFWFFNEANWEVMVKVINGCDFNGFYWIFSAATTDVAYDLKVTDTTTGLEQIYSNGLGEPAPANTDTMALMSCDHGPP